MAFEKVNPMHPDKVADRISGAMVDIAYSRQENPKVAVEVLIGHGKCEIIGESSYKFNQEEVEEAVFRIAQRDDILVDMDIVPQDTFLARNQEGKIRCGDNGIFCGVPVSSEERKLTSVAQSIYSKYPYDGKYILDDKKLIICQSHAKKEDLLREYPDAVINPLGDWTGGLDVDTGATNRKLGSDMGQSVTGGGLCGKDASKADVSVNIWAWHIAQMLGTCFECSCAIGDESILGVPYESIVGFARGYIQSLGGFEKFAEWGLIR